MNHHTRRAFQFLLAAAVPLAVYGFSQRPPPVMRTGAAADGGLNCTACHRGSDVNSGPGSVRIAVNPYLPGVRQTVTVTVNDPDGVKFGFQLTARLKSDETKPAGSLVSTSADVAITCPNQTPAPCAPGVVEFASHSGVAATRPGTPGPRVFTFEWIPPSTNVGEVAFYAAGNATNNSGNNVGDHVYTTSTSVQAMQCNLTGRPAIIEVSNAAARGPIASNGLMSVYGTGFAAGDAKYAVARTDEDWPREFGCIAVEVGGRRAPVFYVQGNQINAQAPILDATGMMDVRVVLNPGTPNEIRSDPARVQVNLQSPALFTADGRLAAAHKPDGTIITANTPARPGDIVVFYGSGFGLTDPVFQPGEFAFDAPVLRGVTATVGGRPVTELLFAGLSGVAPGLYQFNTTIPMDVADGDAAVVFRIGGNDTQSVVVIPVRR
jgi:uncharacterized protein (TIGR03437 family)